MNIHYGVQLTLIQLAVLVSKAKHVIDIGGADLSNHFCLPWLSTLSASVLSSPSDRL